MSIIYVNKSSIKKFLNKFYDIAEETKNNLQNSGFSLFISTWIWKDAHI